MLDVKALKAEMVRNGYTQAKMAEMLGISSKTFTRKMKQETFGIKEIDIMIKTLKIQHPTQIFFA